MTAVGEKGILITTAGNKQKAVPVSSPSGGDMGANIPIGGKSLGVSAGSPSVGEKGWLINIGAGKRVALKVGTGSGPIPTGLWSAREDFAAAVVLSNDYMLVLGGYTDGSTDLNDAWWSPNGSGWGQKTASAAWSKREGFCAVSLSDNSVIILGGLSGSTLHDVWRSADYGATWTEQVAAASWSARCELASVTLSDGSILVLGGWLQNGTSLHDVWRSADQGVTWTEKTAAAEWAVRGHMGSALLTDGSVVITSGWDLNGNVYYNDVWRSTDQGATWSCKNAAAPWNPQMCAGLLPLSDGSLVFLDESAAKAWRSTDQGANWTAQSSATGWSPRLGSRSLVLSDDTIFLMGGRIISSGARTNTIWKSVDKGVTWSQVA